MFKLVLLAIIFVLGAVSAKKSYDIAKDNQGKSGDMASQVYVMSLGVCILTIVVFAMCLMHHMKNK